MSYEIDIEKIKQDVLTFFYKNKFKIFISLFFVFMFLVVFFVYNRNEYKKRIESSNDFIDYINKKNDNFLKKEHKNGYNLAKEIILNKKNPSKEKFDYFASLDDYIFKNLFYFAKQLNFYEKDDFLSYYESDKNPWSSLILSTEVFYSNYDYLKINKKPDYLVLYLIGLGKQC